MPITPAELKKYTEFEVVQNRSEDRLQYDIMEAAIYIDGFIEPKLATYATLPDKLCLALMKVAQFIALANSDESITKGYKSEKIGDYSYTMGDGGALNFPDVSGLLADYLPDPEPPKGMFMRIRPL